MLRIIPLIMLLATVGLPAAFAEEAQGEQRCFTFMEEAYCEAWSNVSGDVKTVEFLKDGDTVDSWSRMITVRRYGRADEIKEVAPAYFESVRPMFALKPEVFKNKDSTHQDNAIFVLTLLAPDKSHYEFVINHFYHDGNGTVWSVFYSHKLPFADKVDFSEVMENRGAWMDSVIAIDAASTLREEMVESGIAR